MSDRIQQLERLLEVDPDDSFCLYGLAMEHYKQGTLTLAIDYFDRTIRVDPGYAYAYFHKARVLEELDDVAAAKAALGEGLKHASAAGDEKARSEIQTFLDALD